jgi:hypothetical protein
VGAKETGRDGTLALVFALLAPLVLLPLGAALAMVFARRSRGDLGYLNGRARAALVLAWLEIGVCVALVLLYLLAIWIGHSNFG